jgi:hypothetical protein
MKKENTYRINYNSIEVYYHEIGDGNLKKLKILYDKEDVFKGFIESSIRYNIYLFKKKDEKWIIKSIKQIINDCKSKKKTLLRKYAEKIIGLSKSDMENTVDKLEKDTHNLSLHIKNIDNIVKMIDDDYTKLTSIFDNNNFEHEIEIINLNLNFIAQYEN